MMYQVIKHKIDPPSMFGWYIKPRRFVKLFRFFAVMMISLLIVSFFTLLNHNIQKIKFAKETNNQRIARNY